MRGLLLTITFFAVPALGDTWYCVAERAAGVLHAERAVIGADVFEPDMKWIVDERGVRELGDEDPYLDSCNFVEGRPTDCGRTDGQWAGYFSLNASNVFTAVFLRRDEDGTPGTYVAAGKCSRV